MSFSMVGVRDKRGLGHLICIDLASRHNFTFACFAIYTLLGARSTGPSCYAGGESSSKNVRTLRL
ncbi:hypothetical protein BS78_04G086400 [Paspalum vaginatum]|nr:hypothetical protein BS78_04G086400 [Paspalum vaginatum]